MNEAQPVVLPSLGDAVSAEGAQAAAGVQLPGHGVGVLGASAASPGGNSAAGGAAGLRRVRTASGGQCSDEPP